MTACKPVSSPHTTGETAPASTESLPPPLSAAQMIAASRPRPTNSASASDPVVSNAPSTVPLEAAPNAGRHYAPKDVYFLIKHVSVTTDSGIVGLPPGSRLVKQSDGSFLGHGQRLHLTSDQYTNDLDLAEATAGQDAAKQEAIKQQQQATAAVPAR